MHDRLGHMYNLQHDLQRNTYGMDPQSITSSGDMSFIKDMVLASISELNEVLNEVSWKPWTHGERTVNTDNYKKEIVDLWHFFMNLMLAVNMTPDELYGMYLRKRQINIQRQLNGYDGKSTKCPECTRALEDVSLSEVKSETGDVTEQVFCQCGALIPIEIALQFITD